MNTEQERTEFETWYRLHHGSRDVYGRDVSGEYVDKQVQGAFNVWQARAALAAQPAAATKAPGDEGAAGIMPRPIVTDAQRCSYCCPYYMDGPVLSICNLDGKPLRYDGIPPLRNEKCKSPPSPTQTGERHD